MCGIAGIVNFNAGGIGDDEAMAAALARMDAAIAHRGPDGRGRLWLRGDRVVEESPVGRRDQARAGSGATVAFAHRRLAIIDLSPGGHQPMASHDRSSWITYNGELYNHRALRLERERDGAVFRSQSDTEVLLDLLRERDVAALDALRGMFAFAWWDERQERLLLARDPFGIKPLVFSRPSPGVVAFASEPRALVIAGMANGRSAEGRRAEFLERGSMAIDASMYSGVEVVKPGEWIAIDRRETIRRIYWSAATVFARSGKEVPVSAAAASIKDAIVESVRDHLVSDVPVGVFLSGGLDSAAILAAASQSASQPIRTFTVTMSGSALDEGAEARRSAGHFGSDHHELPMDGLDVDAALDEFFAAMQEPTIDGFNTFLVARAARAAGVRVALSGVGGDELFGGYPSFTEVPKLFRTLAWAGPALRASRPLWSWWASPRAEKLARLLREAGVTTSIATLWFAYRSVWPASAASGLTGESSSSASALDDAPGSSFDAIRSLECREFLERQLLRDADTFTMCRALELRTPLVDRFLAERVVAAGHWPLRGAASYKAALFVAMPALGVPAVGRQRKRGFVLPMDEWMRGALGHARPPRFADLKRRLSAPPYERWVREYLNGRLHWSRIWALYVLERFTDERGLISGTS